MPPKTRKPLLIIKEKLTKHYLKQSKGLTLLGRSYLLGQHNHYFTLNRKSKGFNFIIFAKDYPFWTVAAPWTDTKYSPNLRKKQNLLFLKSKGSHLLA